MIESVNHYQLRLFRNVLSDLNKGVNGLGVDVYKHCSLFLCIKDMLIYFGFERQTKTVMKSGVEAQQTRLSYKWKAALTEADKASRRYKDAGGRQT